MSFDPNCLMMAGRLGRSQDFRPAVQMLPNYDPFHSLPHVSSQHSFSDSAPYNGLSKQFACDEAFASASLHCTSPADALLAYEDNAGLLFLRDPLPTNILDSSFVYSDSTGSKEFASSPLDDEGVSFVTANAKDPSSEAPWGSPSLEKHGDLSFDPVPGHQSLLAPKPINAASRGSGRLPLQRRIALVKRWLMEHASSPYASETQITELSTATGLSDRQVRVCLSNLRARMKTRKNPEQSRLPCVALENFNNTPFSPEASSPSSQFMQSFLDPRCTPYGLAKLLAKRGDSPTLYDVNSGLDKTSLLNSTKFNDCSLNKHCFSCYGNPDGVAVTPQTGAKRKGKRTYPSRYQATTQESDNTLTSEEGSDGGPKITKPFQCTVCPKSFRDAYAWKRHEAGVHDFHVTQWICMPGSLMLEGMLCAFCREVVDDLNHFEQHNINYCLNKNEVERTFGRKDLLKQHVQTVHLPTTHNQTKSSFKVPDSWAKELDASHSLPESLWCGFCQISLGSTTLRMDHVAGHFRAGLDMSVWYPFDIWSGAQC